MYLQQFLENCCEEFTFRMLIKLSTSMFNHSPLRFTLVGMNRAQRCDGHKRHQSEGGLGCIIMRTTCGHFGTSVCRTKRHDLKKAPMAVLPSFARWDNGRDDSSSASGASSNHGRSWVWSTCTSLCGDRIACASGVVLDLKRLSVLAQMAKRRHCHAQGMGQASVEHSQASVRGI